MTLLRYGSITSFSQGIHSAVVAASTKELQRSFGNGADADAYVGKNMIRKLLGAAAMAAMVFAMVPAQAAKMHSIGCSGPNLEKTETAIEAAPEGEGKYTAEKEVALAQEALLSNKFGVCAMHLSKAAHDLGM
jgi:hypothetical protein